MGKTTEKNCSIFAYSDITFTTNPDGAQRHSLRACCTQCWSLATFPEYLVQNYPAETGQSCRIKSPDSVFYLTLCAVQSGGIPDSVFCTRLCAVQNVGARFFILSNTVAGESTLNLVHCCSASVFIVDSRGIRSNVNPWAFLLPKFVRECQ